MKRRELIKLGAGAVAAAPTVREVRGSGLLVREYLDKLKAPAGQIKPLHEKQLARAFPD